MAKERFQSILGLRKGKAIETVATLANKALANWHMNHTFGKLGYDHLIVKQVEKKGDKFIPDEVASDKGQYAFKEFFMDAFDWDAVKERTVIGTLAQFHEVVHSSGIKNEKAVGKLQPIEIVRTDDETNDVVGARTYGVFSLDTPIPFAKVQDTLQKAIVDGLSGEEVGDYEEEEEEPAVETPVVEETAVETPVVEETVVETPVVEETVVETPVVEETVVEETVTGNANELAVDFGDFEDVSAPAGNNDKDISVGDIEIENFVEEQTVAPAEGTTGGAVDDFDIEGALEQLN